MSSKSFIQEKFGNDKELMEQLKKLNLVFEANRLATYKKWVFPKTKPCSADKLAEAGFVFTGNKAEPDLVECIFCGKPLDGWEATDDPWKEHISHSPQCEFAKLHKREADLTLKQMKHFQNKVFRQICEEHFDQAKSRIEENYSELLQN